MLLAKLFSSLTPEATTSACFDLPHVVMLNVALSIRAHAQAVLVVGRIASYQVVRCGVVLVTTSVTSSLFSLAYPGIGTRVRWGCARMSDEHTANACSCYLLRYRTT